MLLGPFPPWPPYRLTNASQATCSSSSSSSSSLSTSPKEAGGADLLVILSLDSLTGANCDQASAGTTETEKNFLPFFPLHGFPLHTCTLLSPKSSFPDIRNCNYGQTVLRFSLSKSSHESPQLRLNLTNRNANPSVLLLSFAWDLVAARKA